MRNGLRLLAALVLLSTFLSGGWGARAAAPPASDWLPTTAPPHMPVTLRFRGLVPLPSGLILSYAHGYSKTMEGYLYRSSVYDPALETWSAGKTWSPKGGNAAPVVLGDGRVLLTGGRADLACISPGCSDSVDAAQVYDAATDTWRAVAPMPTDRLAHCTARLADGSVLVIGGYAPRGRVSEPVTRTVRYDPRADRWSELAPSGAAISGCSALVLNDGQVVTFGYDGAGRSNGEIYDPAANRWFPLALPANIASDQFRYTTLFPTLLPDGRVFGLFPHGSDNTQGAAIFDPTTNRWNDAAAPSFRPIAVTRLSDGRILATGERAEVYDPASGVWSAIAVPDVARIWAAPAPGPIDYAVVSARASWSTAPLPGGRALLVAGDAAATLGDPARPRACFAETGKCLSGRFLAYWQASGGLAANGFPLTDPLAEELEDGRTYTVQYFERVRLEYHPENPPPHDLLLGQFGRRLHPAESPVAPLSGGRFFPQTGHNLDGAFRDYWEANGGVPRFGYPLGEIEGERLEDGGTYQVQYFERARLEWHPENAAPYDVLVGQFGRRILQENRWLDEDPAIKRRYLTDATLQAALGAPRGPLGHNKLEFQAFEHGAVLLPLDPTYGGGATIGFAYVLCGGTPAAGSTVRTIRLLPDREPPAMVPAPGLGRFIPTNGIGDLWLRDAGVRDCLGYATAPSATGTYGAGYGIFAGGILYAATTPDGPALYILYGTPDGEGRLGAGRYERLPLALP